MNRRVKQGQVLAWLGCLAAVVLVGCQGGRTADPATPERAEVDRASIERRLDEVSPLRVAGTQVTYVETSDGAALEFTLRRDAELLPGAALSERVAEIRRRAQEMASLHARSAGRDGAHDCPCRLICCLACPVSKVELIPGGARIRFAPDTAPLRKAVAEEAARMAR
ncbi:hypothetical protein [Sorangium sp. So ce887]|uniref:hypothetical protein n=1 Tax=Sorangium sp. So ce887 TaxID=3133324 RepID=UPI003F5DD3F9